MTAFPRMLSLTLAAVLSAPSWAAELRVSAGATVSSDVKQPQVFQIQVTGDDPVTVELPDGHSVRLIRIADAREPGGYGLRMEMPLVRSKPTTDSSAGPLKLETHKDVLTLTFAETR